jgi:hypothetical protein
LKLVLSSPASHTLYFNNNHLALQFFSLYTWWSIIKIKLALSSHLTHPYLCNPGLALQLYTTIVMGWWMGEARAPKLVVPWPFRVRPRNGHTETKTWLDLKSEIASGYSRHWDICNM